LGMSLSEKKEGEGFSKEEESPFSREKKEKKGDKVYPSKKKPVLSHLEKKMEGGGGLHPACDFQKIGESPSSDERN